MSTSPISRLVRPAIMLVAGMLLGQGALAVAAPSAPAAVQTRIVSCGAFDFKPIHSKTTFEWVDRILYRRTNGGDGWFMCPAQLPHRAQVTKVRVTVKDLTDRVGISNCGLIRTSIGTTGSTEVVATALAFTGIVATTGTQRYSTSDIQRGTVDNGKYAYQFQCQIVFDAPLENFIGDTGIIGADVTYTISSANG